MDELFVEQFNRDDGMEILRRAYMYSREHAKYPEKFLLPKTKVKK